MALRFSPTGEVHACCVNDKYPLGRIGEASIGDIWRGEALARLRTALDAADYRLGCQDCEVDYRLGERLHTHAEQFDRYPQPEVTLAWPKRVEFALSNTCNLQCVMCNGELSSAIRAQREHRPALRSPYDDAFFDELREVLPHIEVAVFIGGEPFLSQECRRVWDLLIEMDLHPEVHVTTNGTVWDDRVEHYLHSLRMIVAVSIDGTTAAVNDAIRLGSRHDEVVANRDRFLAATRAYGSAFCLNHCLLRHNWHELGDFLLDADALDVGVHVIPVHYPPQLSLFTLPPAELQAIADTLAASGAGERLTRNRDAWDTILAHLNAYASSSGPGSPVALRPYAKPPPDDDRGDADDGVGADAPAGDGEGAAAAAVVELAPQPLDDAEVDRLREELRTWAGQAPVVLRAPTGTIEEVEVPGWAEPLDLQGLVGRSLDDVATYVAPRLGRRSDLQVGPAGEGFSWVTYTHHPGGGDVRFRTAVVPFWGVLTATTTARLPLATEEADGPR